MLLGKLVERDRLMWALEQANNSLNPNLSLVRFYLEAELCKTPEDIEIRHRDLSEYDELLKGGDDHRSDQGN